VIAQIQSGDTLEDLTLVPAGGGWALVVDPEND
jgi:hypothetical protein